jgi:hypothetical protein
MLLFRYEEHSNNDYIYSDADNLDDYDEIENNVGADSSTISYDDDIEAPTYSNKEAEEKSVLDVTREMELSVHYECHDIVNNYGSKPHEMVAVMCYEEIFHMRKCCPSGQNLNLRFVQQRPHTCFIHASYMLQLKG